jgi:prevent-host-death family protein
MSWPMQEARRNMAEVVRRAHDEGGQILTKNGREVAVVVDIDEYRSLRAGKPSFGEYLGRMPKALSDEETDEFGEILEEIRHGAPERRSFEFPDDDADAAEA